mmetsp:Transcript_30323/g.68548  ORF Transcript_30323/g.68548 Transcript_30323/m.68548 type:complete len:378 (-) Transcript_30323:5172-6305(-)
MKMAAPLKTHRSCSFALHDILNRMRKWDRSSRSYTGTSTVEELAKSSSFLGTKAMVQRGRETTVGVSNFASARYPPVYRAPCSTRPWRVQVTGPSWLLAVSLQTQLNVSSSRATLVTLAVCCRRALRKIRGLRRHEGEIGFASASPDRCRSNQPSIASFLCTTASSHRTNFSGPSHWSDHSSNTFPLAKQVAADCTEVVRRSTPLRTRATAPRVELTSCTRLYAFCASMMMKLSTGSETSLLPLGTLSTLGFLTRFCQRMMTGCSCADILSRSQPPSFTLAVSMVLSWVVIFSLLFCCTTLSMLGGRPSSDGVSTSGSCLMTLRNSEWDVLSGTTMPLALGRSLALLPPMLMLSGRKYIFKQARRIRWSKMLSILPP